MVDHDGTLPQSPGVPPRLTRPVPVDHLDLPPDDRLRLALDQLPALGAHLVPTRWQRNLVTLSEPTLVKLLAS